MHKYQKDNIIIVAFLTIFLISITYIYFDHFTKSKEITYPDKIVYETVNDENVINELYNEIINNNFLLLSNDEVNINNVDNINMQTKINLAYYSIKNNIGDIYEEVIPVELMEEYFKNVFEDTIYWDKNDIYCTCGEKLFIFNIENNSYIYNSLHMGHNSENTLPYYTKIIEVKSLDNEYIVTLVNVWNTTNNYGYINKGYASYNDSLNNKNLLFEINIEDEEFDKDINYYAVKEIEDNDDLYKNKLKKHKYIFKKKDNKYYLKEFRID